MVKTIHPTRDKNNIFSTSIILSRIGISIVIGVYDTFTTTFEVRMSNIRINVFEKGASVLGALSGFGRHLAQASVEAPLLHLLYFRVSQINGCAFCLDMHAKDLHALRETGQRLYVLPAWREAPFYSERERAALEWAEALTTLEGCMVSDDVYATAREQFSETELIDLTLGVIAVNSYNRLNIAFGAAVGTYRVGQFSQKSQLQS